MSGEEMFWLSETYVLRDIYVEVTVWLNLIAADGPIHIRRVTLKNQAFNYTITLGMRGPRS